MPDARPLPKKRRTNLQRLNRRDLFKVAVGTVGAAVVGKVAPEAEPVTFASGAWVQYHHQHYIQELAQAGMIDWPQPVRADEVWSALQKAQQQYPLLTLTQGSTRNWPCTDEGMPSIWSLSDDAQHLLPYDGEPLSWPPYLPLPPYDKDGYPLGDEWEKGEGFDA